MATTMNELQMVRAKLADARTRLSATIDGIAFMLAEYAKVGGQVHEGDVQRRETEVALLEGEVARLEMEEARLAGDTFTETAYWQRRFHTSLAIAHGALIAGIGAHVFDKDLAEGFLKSAWLPMAISSVGLLLAGLIPAALSGRRVTLSWVLAWASAAALAATLAAGLFAIWRLSGLAWPGIY